MSKIKNAKFIAPLVLSKFLKKDSVQRKRINAFLAQQMGKEKGLWLKFGQLLSLKTESWEGLEKLTQEHEVPSLEKEDILPYIEHLFSEVEKSFEEEFPQITFPGLAASLSQVHHIKDKENNDWVIKVKLPDIENVLKDQLNILGLAKIVTPVQSEKRRFSIDDYQSSITQNFQKELDYENERKNIQTFSILEQKFCSAKVAKCHPNIQSPDFTIMTKLKGSTWKEVIENFSFKDKRKLANNLISQFIYQYFYMGVAQGDFNPGNFFFEKTLKEDVVIKWIDLGQCLRPEKVKRKALFDVIQSITLSDQVNLKTPNKMTSEISLGPIFSAWNFNLDKLAPIASKLPLLLTKIFTPFSYNFAFNLNNWHLKKDFEQILGDDKWWFRTAGEPDLFLSIRCWIGLFDMLKQLNVPIFFKGIWQECSYEIGELLSDITLPDSELKNIKLDDISKNLNVKIIRSGIEKVNVTLPSRALEDLDTFLSARVKDEIKNAGIDLKNIVTQQLQNGLLPGKVLDVTLSEEHYIVTLI